MPPRKKAANRNISRNVGVQMDEHDLAQLEKVKTIVAAKMKSQGMPVVPTSSFAIRTAIAHYIETKGERK